MVKLRFLNGYTRDYNDRVAAILVKKGRAELAPAARDEPAVAAKPLERMKLEDLRAIAKDKGLDGFETLTRAELIELLKD